jgi:hypothetical protein
VTAAITESRSPSVVRRSSFAVSPNPARSCFVVSYPASVKDVSGLELIDATGKLVRSFRISHSALRISLDGVQPGVYFCKLNTTSGTLTQRLSVAR